MKKILFLALTAVIFTSCKKNETTPLKTEDSGQLVAEVEKPVSDGYELLKNKCYICHNPQAASHDALIAPPMLAVKNRYKMSYKTRQEFVDAVTAWAMDPKKENALMRGAVNQFNVMPKQVFNEEEVRKIAAYMYENELERPAWFEEHFEQMHGKGKGMGRMQH